MDTLRTIELPATVLELLMRMEHQFLEVSATHNDLVSEWLALKSQLLARAQLPRESEEAMVEAIQSQYDAQQELWALMQVANLELQQHARRRQKTNLGLRSQS